MLEILRHRPEIYFNIEHQSLIGKLTLARPHIVKSAMTNYNDIDILEIMVVSSQILLVPRTG